MKRAAVGVAAALALAVPSVARATAAKDAALARKGITRALQNHWIRPADAQRYRVAVTRALTDIKRLPKGRGYVIASQLSQMTPLWSSYISPRALALFSQLEENLTYLESNRIPTTRVDVVADDGVVYRWFPQYGLEFHPLANFGALNNDAATEDVESARVLADSLMARAIPRKGELIWEYQWRYAGGRPPWTSGMAQAVAAQALARTSALLQDPALGAAAVQAYSSVPPSLLSLSTGPWVRLYTFNRQVVLNAQLQAILSLLEYSQTSGDSEASDLALQLSASAQALFPRFDTGDWSRYQLGGAYATLEYQKFVTDLLAKLARLTGDPFWVATSQRVHAYLYDPPQVTVVSATPEIWPQPVDDWLDTAQIQITLSQKASVTLAVGGKVATYKLSAGTRTLTWTPPEGLAPGTYRAQIAAVSYAGKKRTVNLPPLVVRWDTTPPAITSAGLANGTLTWAADDPGTPWLQLAVDYVDPTGLAPPQTQELGQQPTSGTLTVAVPVGTWQVTLRATNTAGLTTSFPLGTVAAPG
jgi:hypothetical protein